jgi:UDP-2-acetamido-2,6-beta-L-arabino-hexul-4-ose reductase
MRIVITGADGFIGSNLRVRLGELKHEVVGVTRATTAAELQSALATAQFVFHLAGVNRPADPAEFASGNVGSTQTLCRELAATGRRVPVVLSSSTQATADNPYGRSKREAEETVLRYGRETGAPVYVYRLTNVFGKWARPFYNSAVATFCHQLTHGLPLSVNDPAAPLKLLYVDDLVSHLIRLLGAPDTPSGHLEATPVYETTVGELARILTEVAESRTSLVTPRVGTGLQRALYATFVSHMQPDSFAYQVPSHTDPRGMFVEMLKTPDCGQFSYFTAKPGVTRGEHYHHSKTEKFLVIQGTAHFGFRNIHSGRKHELVVQGGAGHIVETIPGWTHNVSNIGTNELIVMLWANEIFDPARPDTVAMKVAP